LVSIKFFGEEIMPFFLAPTEFLTNLLLAATVVSTPVSDAQLQVFLSEGNFSEAITHYQAKAPLNDGDRLALALTFTLQGLEGLAQDNYRFGLGNQDFGNTLPFLRLPVPAHPQPESVKPQDLRAMLLAFQEKIYQANQALADFEGDSQFKTAVDLASIRLTLAKDGGEKIKLSEIYQNFTRDDTPSTLTLHLDAADGFWLKAYTHLLLAMSDFVLALDGRPVFEIIAPWLFPQALTTWAQSPFHIANEKLPPGSDLLDSAQVVDLIVSASQLRFTVSEVERFQNVPQHLLAMIQNSRLMLKALAKENDDDHEWLPNSRQKSALGTISAAQYQAWESLLNEAEALLTGKKLLGHWRVDTKYGINLALFFANPPKVLDPFLLYHGKDVLPYLQAGSRSQAETWRRLMEVFEGNFFGFAIWIN
jgi:hypothetical protein